ncbi:MAG: efflux transporter periplasmic adaptor subunit, partial [Alphaproteobacteria bacterium HGW-Alphaproteobacteria-6]
MGLLLTGLTLAVLAVGAVSLKSAYDASLESASAPRDARERVFSVRVQELAPGRHVPVMTAFGEIRSRRQLELRAAAEGPIVELAPEFADGTRVEAGQLLVRVDPADAQSALDLELTGLREAEAEQREAITARVLAEDDLAAARVQLDLRIAAEARQQGLAERGLGTAADRETAELAVSNARQAILSRRQALALAVARVDRAETA